MQKPLLFLILLSLPLGAAMAQNPITDEPLESMQLKQQLRQQYLHNDTAQAIITLYSRRQAGGVGWITASALSALRLAIGSNSSNISNSPYYTTTSNTSGNAAGALLLATPFAAYGASKLVRFSNGHLQDVLTSYGAGQPLPRALRHKLKPRFFKQPIIKYKEVTTKSASAAN